MMRPALLRYLLFAAPLAQGLFLASPPFRYIGANPVVDMVLFNGEQDMFALRANELGGIVDVFMVFEGMCTFVGEPKKTVFNIKDKRFAQFKSRIVYSFVPCFNASEAHEASQFAKGLSWANEQLTREYMQAKFHELDVIDSDSKMVAVVMASDIDEIPISSKLGDLFRTRTFDHNLQNGYIYRVRGPTFYYNVRCVLTNRAAAHWKGARIFSGKLLQEHHFASWRQRLTDSNMELDGLFSGGMFDLSDDRKNAPCAKCVDLENYGWHLSFFMRAEDIRVKLLSFSHTEYAKPPFTELDHIRHHQQNCVDPFDRANPEWKAPANQPCVHGVCPPKWLTEAASDGRLPQWWLTAVYQ